MGGHLEIPAHPDFDLTNQITIAALIQPQGDLTIQNTLLSKDTSAYQVKIQNNKLVFVRGNEYASESEIVPNTWVHVAISFDATAEKDNLKLYIDGCLDKSFDITEALNVTDSSLSIGADNSSLPFTGQMASLAIWNVAHSTWKIMQNFSSPIYEKDSSLLGYWQMKKGTGAAVKDASSKGHDAQIVNALEWKPISDSILVPAKFSPFISDINSKTEGISQATVNLDKTTTQTPLPASGRNGEATKLLIRVKNYQAQQVINKRLAINEEIKMAETEHANKLKEAHVTAAKTLNNSRFDELWFIFENKIHFINSYGITRKFYLGTLQEPTISYTTQQSNPGIFYAIDDPLMPEVKIGDVAKFNWIAEELHKNPNDEPGSPNHELFNNPQFFTVPIAPKGSLIGTLDNNPPFYIGKEGQTPDGAYGNLKLGFNGNPDDEFVKSATLKIDIINGAKDVMASDLSIDQQKKLVFWSENNVNAPFSVNVAEMDGTGHKQLSTNIGPITSIALDELNQFIYYLVSSSSIRKVKYDGTQDSLFLTISGPSKDQNWQLEIDQKGQKVYWTNDYSIWRADLNGANPEQVVSNHEAPFPIDLAIDSESQKLYWVDKELKAVRRSNLDGNFPEDLYAVENPVRGLMLDLVTDDMKDQLKQEVYWVNREEKITAVTPGITHFWPLDEGENSSISDVVKPLNKIVLGLEKVNDDLPEHLDHKSFAIKFDDARPNVEIPSRYINNIGVSSYTISMWIKMDKIENATLVNLENRSDKIKVITFGVDENKKAFINVIDTDKYIEGNENSIKAANRTITGKTNLTSNKWLHLAFRFDNVKKEQSIFVNGKLDILETGHDVLNEKKLTGLVGAPGLLTGLRISYHVLSHKRIKEVKNTHQPAELMNQFILGPKWSRNNFPPILSPPSASLEFDGICPSIILGTAKELGIAYNNFTIEFWFKMNTLTPKRSDSMGISIIDGGPHSLNLHVYESKISEHIISRFQGTTEIKVGHWNHLAFTYQVGSINGAKKVIKTKTRTLYLNGKKENSGRVAVSDISEDENAVICIGKSWAADPFNGAISQLRIWKTVRTAEEIATNYRNYRESFALRGPVDGSETPEQLFKIPAEGGLNLVSKQKAEYEARLIAYRLKKKNQTIAAANVQEAYANKMKDIDSKKEELERTQKEKDAEITAKKESQVDTRTENRNKLLQAKNDKSRKIDAANASAKQARADAQEQANTIKAKANTDAGKMKADATANRDAAKRERDKNKR
jgi:hypothetical protein